MMLEWLGMPVAGAAHAGEVDEVMVLVHWLMLVLFVGWASFFVYVLVRFRARSNPVASYHGLRGTLVDLAGGRRAGRRGRAARVLLDSGLEHAVDAFPARAEATVVRVVAEQFAWNVHYPGPDGLFGRTDSSCVGAGQSARPRSQRSRRERRHHDDQPAVPPGDRPVIVHLSSKDVIHSFALPQMRVKQDAIPGIVQPVWFTPTETGEWEIACSQLCGSCITAWSGSYTVQPQAQFDAWLAAAAALPGGRSGSTLVQHQTTSGKGESSSDGV